MSSWKNSPEKLLGKISIDSVRRERKDRKMDNTWVAQFYEETDPVKRRKCWRRMEKMQPVRRRVRKRKEMHAGKNCGLCAMENADQEKMNLSEALWN